MAEKLNVQQEIDGGVYETVTVYATNTAPHHKVGDTIFCSKAVADKMLKKGWATEAAEGKAAKVK